jgi:integral membrane protein
VITLRTFRIVALTEATTFLILLIFGTILGNDTVVSIMGPIHGLFFLAYVGLTIYLRPDEGWSTKTTLLILLGAVLPFGGYVVDRTILTSSDRSPATP